MLSSLVFILALVFFMTLDGGDMPTHLAKAALVRPQLLTALADFAQTTRTYLVVSTVFGLVLAVLDTVALELLRPTHSGPSLRDLKREGMTTIAPVTIPSIASRDRQASQ